MRVSDSNKRKLIKWIQARQGQLKLHDWVGRISFRDDLHPDHFCEVDIDVEYLRFNLTVSEPDLAEHIKEGAIKDIKRYLTHELVHVLVEPLNMHLNSIRCEANKDTLTRDLENTVQRITRLLSP